MTLRTTLDIDDQVLAAAREMARRQRKTIGAVVSELARRALTQSATAPQAPLPEPRAFYGFRPMPPNGRVVTDETVERLREQEGI